MKKKKNYIYIRFFLKTNGLLVENSKFVMPITNVVIIIIIIIITCEYVTSLQLKV